MSIPGIGEFTKIPLNLLFFMGFVFYRFTPNEKNKYIQFLFIFSLVFHIIFDLVGMAAYLLFERMETSLEIVAYIIYSTFASNSMMKLACCGINLLKIRQALKNLQKHYPKSEREKRDYQLMEHLRRMRKYNKSLTIYHFGVTSMFNFFPLIQSIVLYYQSDDEREFAYELPYPMLYIFDVKKPLGYFIAYATQCTGSYLASCAFLGSDLLLITSVHLINMNFRYLNKIIMEYKPSGTKDDVKNLNRFITYHNDILNTVELVDETFNISILLNYVGTATIICLLGFQLMVGTGFLDLIKFLSFLISVLVHVYFISIFGTEMMTLSLDISEAFTHHPWYDAHIGYQRLLPLPIARAQRPALLHASKFFIISMESFKSLVSTSYQVFTLLKTSYEEE